MKTSNATAQNFKNLFQYIYTMFEYKVLKSAEEGWFSTYFDWNKVQVVLNDLGKEGWELVSTLDINAGQGRSKEVVFLLKRRIEKP
jgi:hypothetical protein